MRISGIGLVKKSVHGAIDNALRKLDSNIGPKKNPKINGANGTFIFVKKYPTIPKMNKVQTSKRLLFKAKDPTAANINTTGTRIDIGILDILAKVPIKGNIISTKSIAPINKVIYILPTKTAFS